MEKTEQEAEVPNAPPSESKLPSSAPPNNESESSIDMKDTDKQKTSPPSPTPAPVVNGENRTEKESCKCECGCQERLTKLENEVKDLVSWRVGRVQLDDIISDWKKEVENWMQSTFGFTFSTTLSTVKSNDGEDNDGGPPSSEENGPEAATNENHTDEGAVDHLENVAMNVEGDAENVEITPDLFGHFLLDNEYDYGDSDDDDIEELLDDESLDEEEEPEVPNEQPTKRRRTHNNDSDSECYTVSSASSTEDITTSEDEYEPQKKRGRGRGRARLPMNQVVQNKANLPSKNAGSHLQLTNSGTNLSADLGSEESRKELLQHCRKRQGNIWECTVCGFMLTSFENMLLHIKYNHSSSTHTCPYCRIVVLCRSPKDAILHQSQCKMRPSVNSNNKAPEPKIIRPVQKEIGPTTTNPKTTHKDVLDEVDKFVDDILGSGPSTKSTSVSKNNIKKTDSPAVVTLSSDED